jgi:flagellum-specific peptidoglycan hydrolase FlgJ
MWYKKMLLAQARLETSLGTQGVGLKNNLFGMRAPNSRKNYSEITPNNFAVFSSWESSIKDRIERDTKSFGIVIDNYNERTYLDYLKRTGYAQEQDYQDALYKLYLNSPEWNENLTNKLQLPLLGALVYIIYSLK